MATLDEFFDRALKIAGDLGKARQERRQKQTDLTNLARNRALDLEERRVGTGERRLETESGFDQQRLDLDRATLKVRESLGLKQIEVGGRQAGVAERGVGLEEKGFVRSGALFNRLFPNLGEEGSTNDTSASFRNQSDEGVLNSARVLTQGDGNRSTLRSPAVRNVIKDAQRRQGLRNTLEQDLINLR